MYRYIILKVAVLLSFFYISCDNANDLLDHHLKDGPIVYAAKINEMTTQSGYYRFRVNIYPAKDVNLSHCMLTWNLTGGVRDSVRLDYDEGNFDEELGCYYTNIDISPDDEIQGNLEINAQNVDTFGNRSLIEIVSAYIYGEDYISFLINAQVDFSPATDEIVLEPRVGAVGNLISYEKSDGSFTEEIFVKEARYELVNAKSGGIIRSKTRYLMLETDIDTLESNDYLETIIPDGIGSLETIKIMTYNISQALHHQDQPNSPHYWPTRKVKVIDLLQKYDADILCAQEDNPVQINDIIEALNYSKYGVAINTGIEGDNARHNSIFYRSDRFSIEDSGHFWFSETPNAPSRSWDSSLLTQCIWVKLYDNVSQQSFYIYNNHFDHEGSLTRENSALILQEKIETIPGNVPVIVTGDLNCDMDSQPISILNGFLTNTQSVSVEPPQGPLGTYTNFLVSYDINRYRLDYIFVNNKVKVFTHDILTDSYDGLYYPSDHLPILSKIKFD